MNPIIDHRAVTERATDEEGNRYLIEMQNATDHDIRQRLVYYACRLVDQMGEHSPSLREDYQLRNTTGERLFSDLLTIIPLQLPCIKAENAADCRKSYEVLLYLLQSMSRRKRTKEELLAELDTLDLPEETLATFRRVVNTVAEDLTEAERRDYEVDLEHYIKTMGMIRTGREEGRAEGRTEKQREIARAMKEDGLAPELIAKYTGISIEEAMIDRPASCG